MEKELSIQRDIIHLVNDRINLAEREQMEYKADREVAVGYAAEVIMQAAAQKAKAAGKV